MVNYTISLSKDSVELLKKTKERDKDFNFSKFIQKTINNDNTILTEDNVKHIIEMNKIEISTLQSKIEHLELILPTISEKEKKFEFEKEDRINEKIKIYKESSRYRKWTKEKEVHWAKIHAKLVGLDYKELLKICKAS